MNKRATKGATNKSYSLLDTFEESYTGLELDDSLKRTFNGIIDVTGVECYSIWGETQEEMLAVLEGITPGVILHISFTVKLELDLNHFDHPVGIYRVQRTINLSGELDSSTMLAVNKHISELSSDILKIMKILHVNDSENKRYIDKPHDYVYMLVNNCSNIIKQYLNRYIRVNYPEALI